MLTFKRKVRKETMTSTRKSNDSGIEQPIFLKNSFDRMYVWIETVVPLIGQWMSKVSVYGNGFYH